MSRQTLSEPGEAALQSSSQAGKALQLSRLALLLGMAVPLLSVALTIRAYMPCPFWDEWAFVNAIAGGAGATSFKWLWSQHNEHRLLVTRLLILLDLRVFRGVNLSLFIEMYLFQMLQWGAICYTLERFTDYPPFLKRTLQGVFGFCLFHFNQAENFTWAFQASFVLAFGLATVALLAVAFFPSVRRKHRAAIFIGLTPLMAACNVSGGLLLGPVSLMLAIFKRLPAKYVLTVATLFLASAGAYLYGYRAPPSHLTPADALLHPKDLLVYLLTYFGASWTKLLPHKERLVCLLSLIIFAGLTTAAWRNRMRTGAFEWFCIAECTLMVTVAAATALGRLQYGVGQAYAGRYQTPAMLYWASLCALLLITVWRIRPRRFLLTQAFVLLVLIASAATLLPIWRSTVARGDLLSNACRVVMNGNADERAANLLYGSRLDVAPGVAYLHQLWRK